MLASIWRNKNLIYQMTRRDISGRYKGSVMGLFWSFINPIFMLAVYTIVFSVVFKAKWGAGAVNEPKTQFAVILFVGMITHGFFAETLMRAPGLIIQHANYVKKVVFPLEILPVVTLLSVLFHSFISFCVLLIAFITFNGFLHWTIIFAPLVFLPLVILTLGLAWLLSSLGVYIRDIGQSIGIIMTVVMFLSPVFYPLSALPKSFQHIVLLNPLTFIIEQARTVIIWGGLPNFAGLAVYTLISVIIMVLSYIWFQKTRKGFADVI
ncbi:ABC transporter permease [Klebsiella aerogenes]|uniref:Transport permease protein n=2 Tax=Raoultella lignicola TaxID=3040939 RepID=A0ABU9FBH0_9ENTR|nr:ABC transporter permease [Klebsiella aerogenes]ELA0417418.1 ABC transporter permease [Klebsiella aerogenes]ELA1887719.1 ABC transporter permease [Klebsiella aerogenes]MDF0547748.1 ABC transporter permease [Klebsiella aerogenes]HBQ2427756.1 ABC transporter permease [Klebsiella aerogenes]HBW4582956.1 ABC transporter permease [Klebsiella aerogenes]